MRFGPTVVVVALGLSGCRDESHIETPGIVNLGATCYYNSLWQVLAHAAPFKEYVEGLPEPAIGTREGRYIAAAKNLVALLWTNSTAPIDSSALFESFRAFSPGQYSKRAQNDAAEAFEYLVNRLGDSAAAAGAAAPNLFNTIQQDAVACTDPVMQLREEAKLTLTVSLELKGERGEKQLEDLLQTHFAEKRYADCLVGTQRTQLMYAPELLVVNIVRQQLKETASGHLAVDAKRTDAVSVPLNLDLSNVGGRVLDARYALAGVIYHRGTDNRGHYVADFFHTVHNKWVHANDKRTSSIERPPLHSTTAYMYFYLKQH